MRWNKHSRLEGQHAFLGASQYSWLNYDEDKLVDKYYNFLATLRGTQLHELAAKLIEEAGLKGFALDDSGAQVSPKHAGFVVNNGGTAKASDVMRLIDYVVEKVYENSGVRLEKEVRLVGNFGGC